MRDNHEAMSNDRSTTSLWVWRCVILALAAALSVALIMRGNLLIGGLIGALVIARAILIVKVRQRRQELRRRFGQRWEQRD